MRRRAPSRPAGKFLPDLEGRVRELMGQVDDEARRTAKTVKNLKKWRCAKECNYRAGEDNKNSERIKDLIDKLQHQVRMYKKQLEEAEDIAANNLAKYKVVQKVLVEAQEKAGEAELDLERKRGVSRGGSLARDY